MSNEESTPQRARRLGAEYANQYHPAWSVNGRKWIKYAFQRGYQMACIDQAREAEAISDAVDEWEAGGDDEQLVNEHIDPWLDRIRARVAAVKP